MVMVPIAEFAPDQPDLVSNATMIAQNVIPRTEKSYSPLPSLQPFSEALDSTCLGAITVQDTSLATYVFAGTGTKLYDISGGATTWTDVSGATYTTGEEYWRFAQWKNEVIATNYIDPIQVFNLASSTAFADLSSDAPKARHVAVVKGFLMVANTDDPTGGVAPYRLWWSGLNMPDSWPTPGSAAAQAQQSDYQDIPGTMGQITGLVGHLGGCDAAVFFERGVWRAIYQGPPSVFGFYPAEGVLGCRASNSIVQVGPVVYYWSNAGFYVFDGTQSKPIGQGRVDRWFLNNLNQTHLDHVIGAADPISQIVFWIYPSMATSSDIPDSVIMYNWAIDRWSYGLVDADWIMSVLSFGTSLDELDVLYPTGLDTIPYSLDSRVWVGGAVQLGAIDAEHKLSFFSGQNSAAQIATSTASLFPGQMDPNSGVLRPGLRGFVRSVRPQIEGGDPTVAISTKNTLSSPTVWGTDVPVNTMGECPQRADGRFITGLVKLAAGADWDHFQGMDVEADPGGWR